MKRIKWNEFFPPFTLVVLIVILNVANYDVFLAVINKITGWILANFSGVFGLVTFACVVLIVITFFSPVGNIRIGGENCEPLLSKKNYIWISLCTIMAAGILLWSCAEPLYHMYGPPENMGIEPGSREAIEWGLKTGLMENALTPMCIYGIPSLLFAFVFYNMKKEFSVSSMLIPVIGDKRAEKLKPVVDSLCLLCLCLGMSASLGNGVLLLGGGVEYLSSGNFTSGALVWTICCAAIVVTFIVSASTGIHKGIRILSDFNSKLYMILGVGCFVLGPTVFILNMGLQSAGIYIRDFIPMSLFSGALGGEQWARSWPIFYWCNWLSWMPVTAVFLGKISKGYRVRDVIKITVFFPALFAIIWISIFSCGSVYYEMHGVGLYEAVKTKGIEAATYGFFDQMPLSAVWVVLFLMVAFVSFVTAAESNTNAMSALCTKGITIENSESPTFMKVIWGILIGVVCLIMLVSYGVDGIKLLSNLGGFPGLFLMVLFLTAWARIVNAPEKWDMTNKDNREDTEK